MISDRQRLKAAHRVLAHVAEKLDAPFSVRLWDGTLVSLGKNAPSDYFISVNGPHTISTLLRQPSLENIIRHYAVGKIDFHGEDFISLLDRVRSKENKKRLKTIDKSLLLKEGLVFLLSPSEKIKDAHGYGKEASAKRDNKDYIQFHYDIGNDFYALFLGPEMQYSCCYFKETENTLEEAERDKLEITCRKLRLKEGERLLDIGCGWGGLITHAARHYGVRAHGVTLSQTQYDYCREKIKKEKLENLVSVSLDDYVRVEGTYDKIVSVGMFEHIGYENMPTYFRKINSLLRDRGLFLHHAITRRAKASKKKFYKVRPEMRLLQKYIFPGGAIDHIGHSVESMEIHGFEVRDVESWREHYALTTRHWCRRLLARKEEAIKLVGQEKYRLWVGYLAAVSFGFTDGYSNIYQTLAVKREKKGFSGLPMTRHDLYA